MKSRFDQKQISLIDVAEIRRIDLETDADRKERFRLRKAQQKIEEDRHERWRLYNLNRSNPRPCSCAACTKSKQEKSE